jgi:hypothetical protein
MPAFRVTGKVAELWHPDTGVLERIASQASEGVTQVPLLLPARGSVFVVFRPPAEKFEAVTSFTRNGQSVMPVLPPPPVIKIQKAIYGVRGDAVRTRDVRAKLQTFVSQGGIDFQVGKLADGDDPAYGIVKTLDVEFTADDRPEKISGRDTDTIHFVPPVAPGQHVAEVRGDNDGELSIVASQPGEYELKMADGKTRRAEISAVPAPVEIAGAWDVSFPPKWGAPETIKLDKLVSLSESTNAGVKFFSGTATYTKTFIWQPAAKIGKQKSEIWLDLGDVQMLAQVKLNGHDLGALWQPPFRVNITSAVRAGRNSLEVRVANLWRNRMIGDAALPAAERFSWSSSAQFSPDTPLPKSGLIGPVTLHRAEIIDLP